MAIALKARTNRQEKWIRLLLKFHESLKKSLSNNFVELIAPSSPDVSLHDVNVVVVVRKADEGVRRLVSDLARRVEEEVGTGITLITLTLEENDALVEEYRLVFSGSKVGKPEWKRLVSRLKTLLESKLKENFVELIAPSSLDVSLHDVNVVVVVRKADEGVRRLVSDLARRVEEEVGTGITLITLTLEENDALASDFRRYFRFEA